MLSCTCQRHGQISSKVIPGLAENRGSSFRAAIIRALCERFLFGGVSLGEDRLALRNAHAGELFQSVSALRPANYASLPGPNKNLVNGPQPMKQCQ